MGTNLGRKERYQQNRQEVADVYGIDPTGATVHHIVQRSDLETGMFDNLFNQWNIDDPSNLFPFSDQREDAEDQHTGWDGHVELHQKLEQIEQYENTRRRRRR